MSELIGVWVNCASEEEATMIAEEAVKRKLVPQAGRETVRVLLESHDLKPWREKDVVRRRTE